jgi:putative phosphoribosyl transferase
VDEVVCLEYRREPRALRFWYDDFSHTSEQEVEALLSEHVGSGARDVAIEVASGKVLSGHLIVPWSAYPRGAVVVLARGSSSPRSAQRSESLASKLNEAGLATLLLDLLVPGEQVDPDHPFELDVLAQRVVDPTRWLRAQPETARLALGYLGTDAGSAAALVAPAKLRAGICAVVACDGHPAAAQPWLDGVIAPVLLITAEPDTEGLDQAREARQRLRCVSRLAVVRTSSCATERTDAVERLSWLAIDWFTQYHSEAARIQDSHRIALVSEPSVTPEQGSLTATHSTSL